MKTSTTERRERLEQLITAAEQEIQANPKLYNTKVALMAVLGYVVIFATLFVLLAIAGGIAWAALASASVLILLLKTKVIFVLLVMIYVLIRALWIKFARPSGFQLKLNTYPVLKNELKQLGSQLKAPKLHQVLLTSEYNAAIVQSPRLGIFGWYKNTLILGLELLMSMPPEQARSVIAHELGHLSGEHGRFSGWIYRVRLSWERVMVSLGRQNNFGAGLLRRFFDWYAPAFSAYSFALARANEYQADAVAAQLTSKEAAAQALINSHVVSHLLGEQYWQPFIKLADATPRPQASPYHELHKFLQQNRFDNGVLQARLDKALTGKTGHYDTHPALKDRLAALACPALPPEPAVHSAARHWLGDNLPEIIRYFDNQWLSNNGPKWQERYEHMQHGRGKLAELSAIPEAELTADQRWQKAVLTEEFAPDQDCLPLFQAFKTMEPDDAGADFVIGRLLLNRKDQAGVEYMKQAMAKQQSLKLDACDWLSYFYRQSGDTAEAGFWQREAERQYDINQAARQERDFINAKDRFASPAPDSLICGQIIDQLKPVTGVKHVWLVEKIMQHYPEAKTFVLVFEKRWYKDEKKQRQAIIEALNVDVLCFVIAKGGSNKAIAKRAIKQGIELF